MDIITINVGGHIFMIDKVNLEKYPETILSITVSERWSKQDKDLKDKEKTEIFFDRSYILFDRILNFYRTGILDKPHDISNETWQMELDFWNIPNSMSDELRLQYKSIVNKWLDIELSQYQDNKKKHKYLIVPNIMVNVLKNISKKTNYLGKSLRDVLLARSNYYDYMIGCLYEMIMWELYGDKYDDEYDRNNSLSDNKSLFQNPFFENIITEDIIKIFTEKFKLFITITKLLQNSKIFRNEVMQYFLEYGYPCEWIKYNYVRKSPSYNFCDFDGKTLDGEGKVFIPGSWYNNDNLLYPNSVICHSCFGGELEHGLSYPVCKFKDDIEHIINLRVLKFYS